MYKNIFYKIKFIKIVTWHFCLIISKSVVNYYLYSLFWDKLSSFPLMTAKITLALGYPSWDSTHTPSVSPLPRKCLCFHWYPQKECRVLICLLPTSHVDVHFGLAALLDEAALHTVWTKSSCSVTLNSALWWSTPARFCTVQLGTLPPPMMSVNRLSLHIDFSVLPIAKYTTNLSYSLW